MNCRLRLSDSCVSSPSDSRRRRTSLYKMAWFCSTGGPKRNSAELFAVTTTSRRSWGISADRQGSGRIPHPGCPHRSSPRIHVSQYFQRCHLCVFPFLAVVRLDGRYLVVIRPSRCRVMEKRWRRNPHRDNLWTLLWTAMDRLTRKRRRFAWTRLLSKLGTTHDCSRSWLMFDLSIEAIRLDFNHILILDRGVEVHTGIFEKWIKIKKVFWKRLSSPYKQIGSIHRYFCLK